MTAAIAWFEELSKTDTATAGGKGANLGELAGAGLLVLPGFVVIAAGYLAETDDGGVRTSCTRSDHRPFTPVWLSGRIRARSGLPEGGDVSMPDLVGVIAAGVRVLDALVLGYQRDGAACGGRVRRCVRRSPGPRPVHRVAAGEPIAALREDLHRLGYEILVVGTRGTGRSKAVLGSVASGLARGAGIPVLLVDDAAGLHTVGRRLRGVG